MFPAVQSARNHRRHTNIDTYRTSRAFCWESLKIPLIPLREAAATVVVTHVVVTHVLHVRCVQRDLACDILIVRCDVQGPGMRCVFGA